MGRGADPVLKRFTRRYLPRLRRRYRPQLVLAWGDALADSDLDLLVVSERFRGVSFLQRAARSPPGREWRTTEKGHYVDYPLATSVADLSWWRTRAPYSI